MTYNDVLNASLHYFGGDELAANVFASKYALHDESGNFEEKTPDDMHARLAKEFARIEQKYGGENALSYDDILSLFKGFKYVVPQGSPMFGIGNDYVDVSLSNCFVSGNDVDSYSGILLADLDLTSLMKRRGGVGLDLSHLRPKGGSVSNAARTSTGIVGWMQRYSNTTREVAQEGRK